MENFSSDFLKSTLILFEEINQETSILFPDIPQDSVILFLTILNSVYFPLFTKFRHFDHLLLNGLKMQIYRI